MNMDYKKAGWYRDPSVPNTLRWWNGQTWSMQTRPMSNAAAPHTSQPEAYGDLYTPQPEAYDTGYAAPSEADDYHYTSQGDPQENEYAPYDEPGYNSYYREVGAVNDRYAPPVTPHYNRHYRKYKQFSPKKVILLYILTGVVTLATVLFSLFIANDMMTKGATSTAISPDYEARYTEACETYEADWELFAEARDSLVALVETTPEASVTDPAILHSANELLERARAVTKEELPAPYNLADSALIRMKNDLESSSLALTSLTYELDEKRIDIKTSVIMKEVAELKANAPVISFADLVGAGDSVRGTYYKFEAQVFQGDEGDGSYLIALTREDFGYGFFLWTDIVMADIKGDLPQALVEGDIISFVGKSDGMVSYMTVANVERTVPLLSVRGGDITVVGHEE